MAVKQYIGARYVPLLDGDYNPNKAYEPLTVVNFGSASYTSKKSVPAGIAPTDAEYWQQTGFGSQGVAELEAWKTQTVEPFMQQTTSDVSGLQGDVAGLQGSVSGLQGDVSTLQNTTGGLQTSVSSLNSDVASAQGDIDALENTTDDLQNQINNLSLDRTRKYVFVGDSYSIGTTSGATVRAYPDMIRTTLGLTEGVDFFAIGQNGAGFINTPTFLSLFQQLVGGMPASVDKNTITDVIVCGGWNDTPHIGDGLRAAVVNFVAQVKSIMPNAAVHVGMISYSAGDTEVLRTRCIDLTKVAYYYYNGSPISIMEGINNSIASVYGAMDSGGNKNHPTELGHYLITRNIISHLAGGGIYWGNPEASNRPTYTLGSGVTIQSERPPQLFEIKKDGRYRLVVRNAIFTFANGLSTREGATILNLQNNIGHGYMSKSFVCSPVSASLGYASGGETKYMPFVGSFALEGSTLKMYSDTLLHTGDGFVTESYFRTFYAPTLIIDIPIEWA